MGKYTDYLKEKQQEEAIQKYTDAYRSDMYRALSELLKLKAFRFYISDLIGYTKPFETPFDEKGNLASFNAGKQSVGLRIFNDIINIDPEYFVLMSKEEALRAKAKSDIIKEALKNAKNG